MAKVKKINFIGFRTTDEYYKFINQQCDKNQMTLTEYMNSLVRDAIEFDLNKV